MSGGEPPCGGEELVALLGTIDIYVLDQIMRGGITPSMRVLDAGCGGGRNSKFLMRCGAEVHGVDADSERVAEIRSLASEVAPDLPASNFTCGRLSELSFEDGYFDCVVCCAVLHFARDEREFEATIRELWRVLAPGGRFFARLASTIGIESRVTCLGGRRYALPDGSDRFLVDEAYLSRWSEELGGELLDPLKTTVVQNLRAMTTWVLGKPLGGERS